jgi:DNA polymerase
MENQKSKGTSRDLKGDLCQIGDYGIIYQRKAMKMQLTWEELHSEVQNCHRCRLGRGRMHAVPGEGDRQSPLMFVGEGPGQQEDETGRPFVCAAGQLLDKMIAAIGLSRKSVYICNVVKCRPPQNRIPEMDEAAACLPFLRQQFLLIRPKVIVCLGATAGKALIDPEMRITRQRGEWVLRKGIWMMATYHPSALLRDADKKRPAWTDMQALRQKLQDLGVYEKMLVKENL